MTSDEGLVHPLEISSDSSYATHIKDACNVITSAYPETLKPKNNHPPLLHPSGNIQAFLDYYSCPSEKFSGIGFECVPHIQFQLTKIHNTHEHQAVVDEGGHVD